MTQQTETFDTFMDLEPTHQGYRVVHPLYDAPEAKRSADHLGPLKLSRGCRAALVAVRFYLMAIMLMGGYRVVTLVRALRH
jgi:hypothetical protein